MEGQDQTPGSETPASHDQVQVAAFERYANQGGRLIVDGKYAEAIRHFRNKEEAEKAGLHFTLSRELFVDAVSPENVESYSNIVAMNSWFLFDGRRITPSGVSIMGRKLNDIPDEQMNPAVKNLAHEVALVHMEEFLHGLQFLRGQPLAGFVDSEVDVASYMQRNGIPLTDAFLRRYDRGTFLAGTEGKDDSLSKRPAIRRGVFVNVQRSDGRLEPDWQIVGFNPQTGEAIVRNYAQGVEKQISKDELGSQNPEGIYPFSGSGDFQQLFSTLDHFKKIYGTHHVYDVLQLKQLINAVRGGTEDIDKIPRSGGLRLKVAELSKLPTSSINLRPTANLAQH